MARGADVPTVRVVRRLLCAALLSVAACALPGQALAGNGLQPAAGTTTGAEPVFVVALDPSDSQAEIYVATSTAMTSTGSPVDQVGSCQPTTPAGTAGTFTCQPSGYADNGNAPSLPAGGYYWWLTDWSASAGTYVTSGPFAFTVSPTAPMDVYAVSPADGATTSTTPVLTYHLPAGVNLDVYVSDSSQRTSDGRPVGVTRAHCTGTTTADANDTCTVPSSARLVPGTTYYWWVVVTVGGSSWSDGVRSFTIAVAHTKPPAAVHGLSFAPELPSSERYTGKSVKQTRLSEAAYALSKIIGDPKSVAVACWSMPDWENISGDNPETGYTILGFWTPAMPHWLQLSPGICHTMETLLYKRPAFPNRYTANAVDTLTHEMMHALGVRNEAATECFAMQLSWVTAESLGVPAHYAYSLSRLTLANYGLHPPRYINRSACRENGAWDLFKGRPSLPWHNFQV
jgi:hypothetical protein